MNRLAFGAAAFLILPFSLLSAAQEKGNWRADSSTAASITGDITISEAKISINFVSFPLAQIRRLQPAETSAIFDAESQPGGTGNLFRLNVPGAQRFLRHNTLCGSDDTEWMATYVAGRNLHVAFFSGADMPLFTPDALGNSTSLCGTFSYVK
ncbi:MAG TPA: hypothetical protein VGG85_15295 [Terracidiphilus sp.]|jgi:hypothetical protein